MKIPALVRKTAALCLFMASGFASATMLTLPTPNSYEGQLFNNFNVYSLDLLQKCAADPRCQPQAGVPVASGPGQIADQAIVLTSANGMSNFTSPFASGSAVDDVILTPTGNQSSTFPNLPGYGSDAGCCSLTLACTTWSSCSTITRAMQGTLATFPSWPRCA
jgi:hypothetical protein